MSEGTPSIVDIIAPGKTGLSQEEWIKSFELLVRIVRSQAEKTTLVRLSAFLGIVGVPPNAIKKAIGSTAACFTKQGIFFSENAKGATHILTWFVWGVCRDDDLLFLGHVIQNLKEDTIVIESIKPTAKNIFDYTKQEPFTLCCRVANASGEFVNRAQSNLTEAVTTRAKAMMVLEELRRFEK